MISSVLDRPDMLFACLFYRESPGNRIVSTQGVLTSWAAMDDFPGIKVTVFSCQSFNIRTLSLLISMLMFTSGELLSKNAYFAQN